MNPAKVYFTSDTHFGHRSIIHHCMRPWADVDAMDAALIETWNATVPDDGYVFHLGDVSFRSRERTREILAQLKGRKFLVRGNHDESMIGLHRVFFEDVRDLYETKIAGRNVVMCHYPLESWRSMHHGAVHLHGHCHGNLPRLGKRMDVGVDCCPGYAPIAFSEVIRITDQAPIQSRDHHQPATEQQR